MFFTLHAEERDRIAQNALGSDIACTAEGQGIAQNALSAKANAQQRGRNAQNALCGDIECGRLVACSVDPVDDALPMGVLVVLGNPVLVVQRVPVLADYEVRL